MKIILLMKTINIKTILIASAGGHKYELLKILKNLKFTDSYFLTFRIGNFDSKNDIFLIHPSRNFFKIIFNFFQSFYYLLKIRPKLIISTGADVTLFTFVLGKIFFRTHNIYIESFCTDKYSITGKISYYFSDLFLIHHKNQTKFYPKAHLTNGGIL